MGEGRSAPLKIPGRKPAADAHDGRDDSRPRLRV